MIADIINCFKDRLYIRGVEILEITLDSEGFDRLLEEVRNYADVTPEPMTLRIVSFEVLNIRFKRSEVR